MHLSRWLLAGLLLACASSSALEAGPIAYGLGVASLDAGWRFLKGDAAGAEKPDFDDTSWRTVKVPHDWSIEGPFDATNPTSGSGAFLPSGIGWYRTGFFLLEFAAKDRVFTDFDGVMANSDVWINGHLLGHRPYGYVSFCYELTDHVHFGREKPNILAVRADDSNQPASRWYAGAGIYRHVRLVITEPAHIDTWGVFVTTPRVTDEEATVHVQTTVVNQSSAESRVELRTEIMAPDGRKVDSADTPRTIPPGKSTVYEEDFHVKRPQIWSLDDPKLYSVWSTVANVHGTGGLIPPYDQITRFGIREFKFDSNTGFSLNGKNLKIKGVCLHHDGGAFGAAVPLGVWQHRLEALKQLGVNAVRTAHNPPSPEFLDLCDRTGFLVMDEFFDCWTVGKNRYDYHLFFDDWSKIDACDTIRRDRNHPSIILYSVGNEIHDTPKADLAKGILKSLVEVCHESDPTRPVTQALFRPNTSRDYEDGLADMLDVIGTNYRDQELIAAHKAKPARRIIGTEQRHDRETWLAMRDNPEHAGQFLWSGVDYLGEALRWPVVGAASGLLDRTGAPKPMAFERQNWWSDKPMVYMARRTANRSSVPADPGFTPLVQQQDLLSDWTPQNGDLHDEAVEVYSNCEEVGLFLNGRSLGSQQRHADDSARIWRVAYEPGILKAIGRKGGQMVATYELRTAGKPAKILLTTDRAKLSDGWDDVLFVTAKVVDANGVLVPSAKNVIAFEVIGPAVIAAVDNGDNASHEPFQATKRSAFQGQCVAILKATDRSGTITLTASASGLTPSSVTIQAASD